MTATSTLQTLLVPCPSRDCLAPPGRPCTESPDPHRARVLLAQHTRWPACGTRYLNVRYEPVRGRHEAWCACGLSRRHPTRALAEDELRRHLDVAGCWVADARRVAHGYLLGLTPEVTRQ